MAIHSSKTERLLARKQNPWRIPAFCFRLSILTIFAWLVISSIISLMMYFYHLSDNEENLGNLIFNFSTWLFILPSIACFGLINAMPLIIPWLMKPVEEDSYEDATLADELGAPPHHNSYQSMAAKLELGSEDSEKS